MPLPPERVFAVASGHVFHAADRGRSRGGPGHRVDEDTDLPLAVIERVRAVAPWMLPPNVTPVEDAGSNKNLKVSLPAPPWSTSKPSKLVAPAVPALAR